jgi:hypothetical protein
MSRDLVAGVRKTPEGVVAGMTSLVNWRAPALSLLLILAGGCTEDTVGNGFGPSEDVGPNENDAVGNADTSPDAEGPLCWPTRRGSPAANGTTSCTPDANRLAQVRQIPGIEPAYLGFARVDASGTLYALTENEMESDSSLYKYEPGAESAEIIQEFNGAWLPVGPRPGDMGLDPQGRIWLAEYRGDFSDPSGLRLAGYTADGSLYHSKKLDFSGSLEGNPLRFHLYEESLQAHLRFAISQRKVWKIAGRKVSELASLDQTLGNVCSNGGRNFHLGLVFDTSPQIKPEMVIRDRRDPSKVLQKVPLDGFEFGGGGPLSASGEKPRCAVVDDQLIFASGRGSQDSSRSICIAPLSNLNKVSCHSTPMESFSPLSVGHYGILYPPNIRFDPENAQSSKSYEGLEETRLRELIVSSRGTDTVFRTQGQWIYGVTPNLETLYAANTGRDEARPAEIDISSLGLQDVQFVLPAPNRVYIVDFQSDGDSFNLPVYEVTAE